jgi:hypothetical protein
MPEKTNPYVAGAPVTDRRMFFGREDVFTWIEHNIGGQFSDNMLVIHGQRRVGKTSVLKQLGNYISDKYIPVFFDFQGRTHTTLNRFLYRLAREIVRTLSREHDIKMPRPDREDFEQVSVKGGEEYSSHAVQEWLETRGGIDTPIWNKIGGAFPMIKQKYWPLLADFAMNASAEVAGSFLARLGGL